ncbi:MAG: alpha-amylase family glycosyl hydrolase [Bacteroidetes bacterium]|nr:alpha-amylase family glycosyl hydrolase [Bacteroidota bacterium]
MKRLLAPIFLITGMIFFNPLFSQTIVTIPVYPVDNDSATVIYDASKGNAELKDVSPPIIYAHTGVITDLSTSPSDWKHVIANWDQNIPKALMTPLGNNLYQIKLQPGIRAFYGVPPSEKIMKLAFVFRNADGSKVGREAGGGDIYADVYPSVTSVNITEPTAKALYLKLNDTIKIAAISPLADTLSIFVNNTLVKKSTGQTITDTILANNFGHNWAKQWVKIVAKNDTATAADSLFYVVLPDPPVADLPAGTQDGINYIDSTTVVLSLFAPFKNYCFLIGDVNNWQLDSVYYMNRTPDGTHYWFQLNSLTPRLEYIFQYLVNGSLHIADPYADKISDPQDQYISQQTYPGLISYPTGKTTEIASVFQTAQQPYQWSLIPFNEPKVTDLVIYELLIRDFTSNHDYPSLIDTLNYLKRLGINAIELMPVMEFEGNSSWGYNPDFEFAPDKYYGTKNGLKQFVDAAHSKGMAVILDIVLNHQFGQSPLARLYWDDANNRPAANSPWFNPIPKHPFNVGNDFNHQSFYTQQFCERVIKYWVTEFHIDGYRFDLSKGFTQVNSYPSNSTLMAHKDPDRIAVLNTYLNSVRAIKQDVIFILEHFADNDEETLLSANGMLLWGNTNYNYNQATEGWNSGNNSDFSWISYEKRGWADPHVVGYMESHDEERLMYNNITYGNKTNLPYNCRDTVSALKRMGMAATFFYTIPGPKMLLQYGELGYDYSINYPSGTSDSRMSPKPIRWDYYNQYNRKYLYNTVAALMDLKKNQPVFESADYSVSLSGPMKSINLRSTDMNVTIVGNFDVKEGSVTPGFHNTGSWFDYFSGDTLNVLATSDPITLQAGEYHLYTSKKLPRPAFTGIDDHNDQNTMQTGMLNIFPNPSSDPVHIRFTLKEKAQTRITIVDIFGKRIYTLLYGMQSTGTHEIGWNLENETGMRVPAGIYLCLLETANRNEVKKLVVKGD